MDCFSTYLSKTSQLIILMSIFLILVLEAITYLYTRKKIHLGGTILFFITYIVLSYLDKSSEYTDLLISFFGVIFLVLEALVPGVQVFGILGAAMFMLGFSFMFDSYILAITVVTVVVIIAGLYIYYLKKKGYSLKGLKKLVLEEKNSSDKGFITNEKKDLINKTGITTTPLRPSGFGNIDGQIYDLFSYEGFIEKGEKIIVVKEESMKIFVRRI